MHSNMFALGRYPVHREHKKRRSTNMKKKCNMQSQWQKTKKRRVSNKDRRKVEKKEKSDDMARLELVTIEYKH